MTYIQKISHNLREFCNLIEKNNFFLSQSEILDLSEIRNELQDLELQRSKLHELWEVESIKCEALRNKLDNFPSAISLEIQNAIQAARGLNQDNIDDLRLKLDKLNVNIDKYSTQLDKYNEDNDSLIPDLEKLKVKHEEIVVLLNQHLALKADKQIDLNEIRNEIHRDNEEIYELEKKMVSMKEQMIKERAEFREQMRQLKVQTDQTQSQLESQSSINTDLNKIYNDLKHEAAETSNVLTEKNSTLRKHIKSIGELKLRSNQLAQSIDETMLDSEQLKQESSKYENDLAEARLNFDNWKIQINEDIQTIKENVKMSKQIQSELTSVKDQTKEDLDRNIKLKEEASQYCRILMDRLKDIEETSATKAGDVGLMEFEIQEMEKQIIENKENHEATVTLMNNQINELKKQLEKERKERTEVQGTNSLLQDEINKFRNEHMSRMREMNTKMNKCKSEHMRLTSQSDQMQNEIKENSVEVERIQKFLEVNRPLWKQEENDLIEEVGRLNREILEMEEKESFKKQNLKENEPQFEELKFYFEKQKKDYERMKKDLVALKSRKAALEDSLKRLERNLEKELKDQEALIAKKSEKSHQLSEELENEADERSKIEKNIYVNTCHISTLSEEIVRLESNLEKLQKRIGNLRQFWEKAIHHSSKIKQNISVEKTNLEEGWNRDEMLEMNFKEQELEAIDNLKTLLRNTEDRQVLIANISKKLLLEIYSFDKFIDNMASINDDTKEPSDAAQKLKVTDALEALKVLNANIKELKDEIHSNDDSY